MSLKKRSKVWLLIGLLGVIGIYVVYKIVYKPHKTIEERELVFSGTTEEFSKQVKSNISNWQNKVVELTGEISSKDELGFTLNENTYCQLSTTSALSNVNENNQIKIKGRVIGYDDLLDEIKLDQCIILN